MTETANKDVFTITDKEQVGSFARTFEPQLEVGLQMMSAAYRYDKGSTPLMGAPLRIWADSAIMDSTVSISLEKPVPGSASTITIHYDESGDTGFHGFFEIRTVPVPVYSQQGGETTKAGVSVQMHKEFMENGEPKGEAHWFTLSTEFPLDGVEAMAQFIQDHGQKQESSPPLEPLSTK